jgi:hypothetical protein
VVDVERRNLVDVWLGSFPGLFGDLVAGFGVDLAGFLVDDVLGQIRPIRSSSVTRRSCLSALFASLRNWRGVIFAGLDDTSPVLASIRS